MILERRVVVQQLLTGVFWEVVVRLRMHERQHGWTSRFVNLGNLDCCFFSTSRARECGWLLAAATRRLQRTERCVILSYLLLFFSLCGQAIIAAAGRRLWRRWSTAGPWEVRFTNIARQSFAHFASHYVMTPFAIRHHCGCTSSAKRRTLQVRASGLFVLGECGNFLLVPCCQRVGRSHESVGENFEFHRDELPEQFIAFLQSFLALLRVTGVHVALDRDRYRCALVT